MTNDYKPDTGKPPVMEAVFIPYRRTLLAIAAMKADMAEKHKLQGAANPFEEWRHLPNAKRRLSNAGGRHTLNPWEINHADGKHLHIIHAICGLMMAAELHLEEQEALLERLLADKVLPQAPPTIQGPAGADWREGDGSGYARLHAAALRLYFAGHWSRDGRGPCAEDVEMWAALRDGLGLQKGAATAAGIAPTGFENPTAPGGHYWTGDRGTWHCTCGAGRPGACTCNSSNGENL